MVVLTTACWRPNVANPDGTTSVLIQVVFDSDVTAMQRQVTWETIAEDQHGYNFTTSTASNKLYIHGNFPPNDFYPCTPETVYVSCTPAMAHIDWAQDENGLTWRADVFLRPESLSTHVSWGVSSVLSK